MLYYSMKVVLLGGLLYLNFYDILLNNVVIQGSVGVKLQGFEVNIGGYGELVFLFGMLLINVIVDMLVSIVVMLLDVNLMFNNMNLLLFLLMVNCVVLMGSLMQLIDLIQYFDCLKVFVDFFGIDQLSIFGMIWVL